MNFMKSIFFLSSRTFSQPPDDIKATGMWKIFLFSQKSCLSSADVALALPASHPPALIVKQNKY